MRKLARPKENKYNGRMVLSRSALFSLTSATLICFLFLPIIAILAQENGEKKGELERQLQQLEQEALVFDKNIQVVQNETRTLANEVGSFNVEIKRRELDIKKLTLVIQKTGLEIKNKTAGIATLTQKIGKSRQALAASLFFFYIYDQDNLLTILLKNVELSDFFGSLYSLSKVQSSFQDALGEFKKDQAELKKEKEELEDFEVEQRDLKVLQEVERRFLAEKKKEKDEILRLTKGKEALFQQLLQSKKRDIATLKTQLFYLEKTGITAEEAVRLAILAADRTGIRPAFLLALLEVETGRQFEGGVITVGTNLGTGNWRADMNPNQYDAFLKITGELGFDPDRMQVSARPCAKATRERIGPGKPCGYGWGGAMGPAQFIPTTWLLFESKVLSLTGHKPPSPWNVEDAFTAAAIFLSDAGAEAQTVAGETRAAKTYLSGRPTCRTASCNSYASSIIALARNIGRTL